MKLKFIKLLLALVLIFGYFTASPAWAKEEYARRTGQGCIFCHQESTGGQLKTMGIAYIRNGYQYPISEAVLAKAERLQQPGYKTLRFIIGYLHLLAAVIFFGAIFYIHIFIRPTRLTGGIPKAERILGLSCMLALTLTGIYLTWVRLDRWGQFFDNTFGLMLFIKIILFALMICIGLVAITVVHRHMKAEGAPPAGDQPVTLSSLQRFDGADGRPAYFVHDQMIYDASQSPKWKNGRHFGKHQAGTDLTEALKGAPHGPEVFERIRAVGRPQAEAPRSSKIPAARKAFIVMAYTNLALIFLILGCISIWRWDFPLRLVPEKRPDAIAGQTCIECHKSKTPGIFEDWRNSAHAKADVHCDKCHHATDGQNVLVSHLKYYAKPIAVVVSPKNCQGCHPKQAEQYARSKHANTFEIMWKIDLWLNDGMNNAIEKTTGCYACHGSKVEVENGTPISGTWPNVGVGRINPDGSKGSCTSCHTRHRFSLAEARKPEACGQCHLGPDHPQFEIYNESKHGAIYRTEGAQWRFDPDNHQWRAGVDFRAPTCAACHMSAITGQYPSSHDVTERLSWELQAPITIRPDQFKPFPANTDWRLERQKMMAACRQCHSETWTQDHFNNLDQVIENYNQQYFTPAKSMMDQLYTAGLVSKEKYFDEEIEWQYYEFWHHEGRRARMGTAMMAPDYAWWHGFYELKHRFAHIEGMANELKKKGNPAVRLSIPGKSME
ncbi:MAG: multiheme c-type cytochrome [Desulfobacteraceae bacterium]|nr:multiheme c-type cytochrome [Desulfobacteraceae bacterium]